MGEFFTLSLLVKVIAITFASFGFSMVIKIRREHVPYATALATITYIVYYTVLYFGASLFIAAFVSTAVGAVLSETLARLRGAPTIIFLLSAVIPTVPGGNLYYAMRGLIAEEMAFSTENLFIALKIALGIAGGTFAVAMIYGTVFNAVKRKIDSKKRAKTE